MAQTGKNLPARRETWVRSLGREDPLEKKDMATHSSLLGWRIPWTEEPGELQFVRCKESDVTERVTLSLYGQRAWWATVHGVTKSQTQLSD